MTWENQQIDCAPSKDPDQPGHPPSLIWAFPVRLKKAWVLSYPLSAQQRLWSDWADAMADMSFRWAHSHFVGFVMRQLNYSRATSWENLSSAICQQVRLKPAGSATETNKSWNFGFSKYRYYTIYYLGREQQKAVIRLHGCTGYLHLCCLHMA